MTFLEKVSFLKKAYNLSDRGFCTRFKIKPSLYKLWLSGTNPSKDSLEYLCKTIELDIDDFMSDNSSLTKDLKKGEHLCKVMDKEHPKMVIYEDFAREDNSRYEERD